jgi:hypothetical protein
LTALSLASEPELLKNTFDIGTGISLTIRSDSVMATSLALPPNWW